MPVRRPLDLRVLSLCFLGAFGASSGLALASDDPLLLFLANPTVQFRHGAGAAVEVVVTTHVDPSVPDGEAAVAGISVDPSAMTVSYRRIDQTLRPWVTMTTSAPAQDVAPGADAHDVDYSFGTLPAVAGATYEVRVGVDRAIAWKPATFVPPPAEFGAVVNQLRMGSCFEPSSASGIVAAARATIDVVTIPSAGVASPDVALAEAKRAFVNRPSRVLRDGAGALLDYASPHACDRTVALTRGERVKVLDIMRVDVSHATSVGPSGVPAAAALPAHVERHAPNAVLVTLAHSDALAADSVTLTFASIGELRQYLAPL